MTATRTRNVTRRQAERTLAVVAEHFKASWQGMTIPADEDGPAIVIPESAKPQLVEHYETWGGSDVRWAIVWEEGPFEWTMRASMGGVDEEFAHVLQHEGGFSRAESGRKATSEPVTVPKGVFVEPVNGIVLGIYPAN